MGTITTNFWILGLILSMTAETAWPKISNTNSYYNKKNVFVEKLPDAASRKILVISNRHFMPETGYNYIEEVHPENKLFFFVASRSTDTSYITRYNTLEEAMMTFHDESKFLLFVNGHKKDLARQRN